MGLGNPIFSEVIKKSKNFSFRGFLAGLPRYLKIRKVLELAKENSRPWKVLEFVLLSLKILEWAIRSTFNCKK